MVRVLNFIVNFLGLYDFFVSNYYFVFFNIICLRLSDLMCIKFRGDDYCEIVSYCYE